MGELLSHLPLPLAAELREHLPEIEWSDAGAVETLSGELMFTVPSLRRGYRLCAGRVFVGVYDEHGSASVSEFRGRELVGGAMLEPGG